MTLVAYDASGRIVDQRTLPGARYLWQITLDPEAETVSFRGQANKAVVVTWDQLRQEAPPIPAPPRVRWVGDSDDGSTVTVAVGDEVEVVLESNATTGYGWELGGLSDPAVLERLDNVYRPAPNPERVVGRGGWDTWRFSAAAAGTSVVRLEYRQPWMKDVEPERTFRVTVVVE
jgi:predicted secreted protein